MLEIFIPFFTFGLVFVLFGANVYALVTSTNWLDRVLSFTGAVINAALALVLVNPMVWYTFALLSRWAS